MKLQRLLVPLIPIFLWNNAHAQQPVKLATVGSYNFTSFTPLYAAPTAQEKAFNKDSPHHPDLGYQNPQMPPGAHVVEIISKRTENSKFFQDADTAAKIFVQSFDGPAHYKKDGQWLTIDTRLQQQTNGIYESWKQAQPAGFDTHTGQSYVKNTGIGTIAFNSWELYGINAAGEEKLLAKAGWSHFTAGNEGIKVTDIFDGIDAEMVAGRGAVQTSFIVKRQSSVWSGFTRLILKDKVQAAAGTSWQFAGNPQLTQGIGDIVLQQNGNPMLTVKQATMYAPNTGDLFCGLQYRIGNGQALEMMIPADSLRMMLLHGPAIIDPFYQSTQYNAFTNSGRFGTCTPNTPACAQTGTLYMAAGYQASNATFHWPGWNTIAPFSLYSAIHHFDIGCLSSYVATVGTPDPAVLGGSVNPGTVSIGNPCIPGACSLTAIPWHTWLERSCTFPSATCGLPAYAGCNNTWVATRVPDQTYMMVEGWTIEYNTPAAPIAGTATLCQNQSALYYGGAHYGAGPYSYEWSFSPTFTPLLSTAIQPNITFPVAGIIRLYQRVTDACGNPINTFYDVNVRPMPALVVGSNTPLCQGQTLNLTSNLPGFTYAWTGPSAFTSANQNPVITNTTLSNSGTYRLSLTGNGCTLVATTVVAVNPSPAVTVDATPLSLCEGQQLQLSSSFRANDIRITEVNVNGIATGHTNPFPAWLPPNVRLNTDDVVELTNISSTPMDVGGLQVQAWKNTLRIFNYGLPAGTILPANGILLVHLGTGTDIPAQFYFNAPGANDQLASGDAAGIVLRNVDYIIDAVAMNGYVFPAAANVSAADWSGVIPASTGRAGVIRNVATDNNTAADWIVAAMPAPLQTLGTLNPVTFIPSATPPVLPYTFLWTGPGGFSNATQNPVFTTTAASSGVYNLAITSGGCTSDFNTAAVVITPGPSLSQPNNEATCTGGTIPNINFVPTIAGTNFTWTNDNASIGLAANGAGNIASFTGINTGTAPAIANITVTPSGGTCPGVPKSFTITINPVAVINTVANKQLCSGVATGNISFTGNVPGTVFNWTNDNPAIGLAASGTGDINSFSAVNNSAGDLVANITVTPVSPTGNCSGSSASFTITVHPSPSVTAPAAQVICNGTATLPVNFTSTAAGTGFTWTNDNPAIGLAAAGTGNIAAFTALNAGAVPVAANITVTPATASCPGTAVQFSITVNPTPVLNSVASQSVCTGSNTTAITFNGTPAGTVYTWTNDHPEIGLAASGTGNIPVFAAQNAGTAAIIATIVITPSATNAGVTCTGQTKTITITVNPTGSINAVANQTVCNGNSTSAIAFSSAIPGTAFTWTNSNPSIGLAASGSGNIAAFTAVNNGTAPATANITVSTTASGCPGTSIQFSITVNPTPALNPVTSQAVCTGSNTTAITFNGTPAGTVYTWTNDHPEIGLAASGTGNIPVFAAQNTGTTAIIATIVITPAATSGGVTCTGQTKTFTITVNPAVSVNTVAGQTICNGNSSSPVTFSGAITGTVFTWTNNNPSVGLAAGGTGNIPSFIATNTTTAPVTATISVMPSAGSCPGVAKQFTITVNPTPDVNAVSNVTVCNGFPVNVNAFGGTVAGTVFTWTNSDPAIGLAASGTGNIPAFAGVNAGTAPVTATITVTSNFTNAGVSCNGSSKTFTITISNAPKLGEDKTVKICAGATADLAAIIPATGLSATWTDASGTVISPAAVGLGIYRLVAQNAAGCNDTASVTVQQYAAINLQVISNPSNTTVIEGQTIQLLGSGTGTLSYQWAPVTGLAAPQSAVTAAVPVATTHYRLTATNEGGCTDTAGITIKVLPLEITVSGAFTPNGDGYTDLWIIKNLQYARSNKVAIFNRWGNKVYEAANYQNNWDGRRNGNPLPDGAYYYQVQVITAGGTTINKSGSITMIR